MSSILNCAEAAIEKTEQLAADVKKYHTDKAEREMGSVYSMEAVNPVELAVVAEAFEAHQQETVKEMAKDKATKNVPVKSGKSR